MKNVYHFPNQRSPWRFVKSVKGKRFVKSFQTRKEAEAFARRFLSELSVSGDDAAFVSRDDIKMLTEIKRICGDVSPLEAVKFWALHGRAATSAAVSVEKAFGEFLEWLEASGRSRRHIDSIKTTSRKFCARFGEKNVSHISKEDLLTWATDMKLSARTQRNYIANVVNFLGWCKVAKSWILDVPKVDDRLLPRGAQTPVEIWNVDEAEHAIRHLEQHERAYVPHYSLRLFAGLRTSEARQMRWEWIDFDKRSITVPAHVCKTRDSWIILPEFCPETVFRWLEPFRKANGPIKAPAQKAATRISHACNWKPNVMRHTFATMLVAFCGNENKAILATRHTSISTLRAHYRGVNQTKKDAQRFFALRPLAQPATATQ